MGNWTKLDGLAGPLFHSFRSCSASSVDVDPGEWDRADGSPGEAGVATFDCGTESSTHW
jgi:hypothetical protein